MDGARVMLTPDTVARPFLTAGVSFASADTWTSLARFEGVPNMQAFEMNAPISDLVGRIDLGVDVQSTNGLEVKFQYNANVAEDYLSQGVSLRLGYKF